MVRWNRQQPDGTASPCRLFESGLVVHIAAWPAENESGERAAAALEKGKNFPSVRKPVRSQYQEMHRWRYALLVRTAIAV